MFLLLYGKIKGVSKNDVQIQETKLEKNISYKIFFIKNSRFYTDTINDTAFIKDNLIIDGPSFQLRDNKNAQTKENIVFQKGTPRLKKKINGKVLSLLTGGGGNSNYWHWLFDVLPRIFIFSNHADLNEIDYFLFPNLDENFQKESLKILNLPLKKCLSSKHYRHFSANEVIATDHPYNFLNEPLVDSLNIPSWISSILRKKFNYKKEDIKNNLPRKFYIDRSDSKSLHAKMRTISNENDVVKFLKNNEFSIIKLSDFSFTDQIQLFNQAECVVGLHGAGFANMIFSKPNTKIIELKSFTAGAIIENLAKNHKLSYHCLSVKPKISFNNQLGEIKINIDLLKDAIR
tara:strand:+ start:311 stop:1348 length:1038 start_codon:yes stop_codon:yes gene_type:complete